METGSGRVAEEIAGTAQIRRRVYSYVSVRASIIVAGVGVGVSSMLRGSADASKGAKLDMFHTIKQKKFVGVTPQSF